MNAKNRADAIESLIDCMRNAIDDYAVGEGGIDVASAQLLGYHSAASGLLWSLYTQKLIDDAELFRRMQELGIMTTKKVFRLIP
jgi:hypothetical protein